MKFPILQGPTAPPSSPSPSPSGRAAAPRVPKPLWLKVQAPGGERYRAIKERQKGLGLFTVCEEARCPNIGECWGGGTATIMLMGGTCTRGCRFCAVTTGKPLALDPEEPRNAARSVVEMGVDYIVLTSVNRDDLPDGGAEHFASCVRELKRLKPEILVEVLIPDFQGRMEGVDTLIDAACEVIAHNVETVPRLTRRVRDARATFEQSLAVLGHIKTAGRGRGPRGGDVLAKTSLMVGLGETEAEIIEALTLLRGVDVDVVTFGQYLRPSPKHLEVVEYVRPEVFDHYADLARELGFAYVASGPLVRSSYRAGELFLKRHLETQGGLNSRGGRVSAVLPLETGPSLEVEARIVEGVALASAVEAHLANLAEAGHIGLFPPAGRARVAMTAAALATEPGDMLFGTARDWVAALARGVTVDDLFLQMFARASASGGGRTLPGAVQDPARGVVLSAGAPAAHLLHAAGFGHAAALRGGDERVAIGLFGSAVAFSQDAHRAFTLAGVAGARVVFVARGADGGVGSLHRAAEGWGLRVVTVDGDDGGAVFRAVQRARDRALAGKGPTLVDARHGDAPPVPHDALVLQRAGRLSSEAERAVDAEIRAAIMTARSAADAAAAPGPETLPEHVRAEAAHEDR